MWRGSLGNCIVMSVIRKSCIDFFCFSPGWGCRIVEICFDIFIILNVCLFPLINYYGC